MIDVLVKAAITRAVAALPFLGWPIIGPAFSWLVTTFMVKFVYEPIANEIILRDIARENFENQAEFDKAFFKVKLIDKGTSTREQRLKVINEAHESLDKFALYRLRAAA